MAITSDIISGATTGASLGASFGPPGMAVGAVVGAVAGGISGNEKNKKRQKAQRLSDQIAETSAPKAELLAETRARKKQIEAGATRAQTRAAREARSAGSTTAAAISRTAGGSAGAAISGLLRNRQSTTKAAVASADVGSRLSDRLFNTEIGLVSDMDNRKLWLETYKRDTAMAEAGMAEQTSQNNFMAAIGLAPDLTEAAKGFSSDGGAGKSKGGADAPQPKSRIPSRTRLDGATPTRFSDELFADEELFT